MEGAKLKNGYTRIANDLMEAMVSLSLTASEYSVLLLCMRKIYGYQKYKDAISISQFEASTKYGRKTIKKTLRSLQEKNILICVKKGQKNGAGTVWKIQKDFTSWVGYQSTPRENRVGYQSTPEVGYQSTPTKERKKKESNKANQNLPTPDKLTKKKMEELIYEHEDRPETKKYGHKGKLYARIAVQYMNRKGEDGNAKRHFKQIAELVELTEKALQKDGLEVNEKNVLESIQWRFDRADKYFGELDWGLNGLINNFNRVAKSKQSR